MVAVVIESGAASTVSVVFPETLPSVAEMVVGPAETAVAKPPALIVARAGVEDAHVTCVVRFWVVASE